MFSVWNILVLTCFFAKSITCALSNSSTNGDVAPCLSEFYSAVYDGTYNCTKGFDFLEANSTSQRAVFTSGKSCLLQIAKVECTDAQYNLLSTKYDDFLDVLSNEPQNATDCFSFYYKYNALKCNPMYLALQQKVIPLASANTKINDSRVLEAMDMCSRVQTCFAPTCYLSGFEKNLLDNNCEMINMKNTEFTACLGKIQKQAPDMSEYKCLDGMDFYDNSPQNGLKKLTTKKECLKEIMEDICGKKAVENYDHDTGFMLTTIKQAIGISGTFSNT